MQIRTATKEDLPEIVQVLKASLGEDDLPLSEEIWNYKHVINPFGESLALVAEEDGKIIGVRAFMRWEWQLKQKKFSALRAVDTATHPDHRGKGIFKKLTLKAVEIAKQKKDHFVFNTPNNQSRPGYLKMGWEVVDKLAVGLHPAYNSFYKLSKENNDFTTSYDVTERELEELCKNWNKKLELTQGLFTPKSPAYLKWRFQENPLQNYEIKATSNFYAAVNIKKRKKFKELRIVEIISSEDEGSSKEIDKLIKKWSSKFGAQVISSSPMLTNYKKLQLNGQFGPILTLRELNLDELEKNDFLDVTNWSYSLGDLELF